MSEIEDLPGVARVLQGLREAEASPGMEARVLERLAAADAQGRTRKAGGRWLPVALRWACAVAVVCGAGFQLWPGLLLRMLRGGDTGELVATLAPGAEVAVGSQEKEQFRNFFRPAPVSADPAHPAEKPLPDTGLDDGSAVPPRVVQTERGETQ